MTEEAKLVQKIRTKCPNPDCLKVVNGADSCAGEKRYCPACSGPVYFPKDPIEPHNLDNWVNIQRARLEEEEAESEAVTNSDHEAGHIGLAHVNGGTMNPSVIQGLPVSWAGFDKKIKWENREQKICLWTNRIVFLISALTACFSLLRLFWTNVRLLFLSPESFDNPNAFVFAQSGMYVSMLPWLAALAISCFLIALTSLSIRRRSPF